jgi:hypothetical protein
LPFTVFDWHGSVPGNISDTTRRFFVVFPAHPCAHTYDSLTRASLATARFILSLDPLRDPMGVLLALDHFALQTMSEASDVWLIELVDSQKVGLLYSVLVEQN